MTALQERVEDLLTIGQVSRETGRSVIWIRHLAATGKLPSARVGGRYVFSREDVERYFMKKTA